MIDVAFTGAEARAADVAVVVDVLRATSTATQALAAGYRSVICVESIARARELRGPGRVLAGEESCRMPPGFDRGNSPIDALRVAGEELVLATTNGAPTIVAATGRAPIVLLACLLNLDAVTTRLRGCHAQVVCAGTNGVAALEDVYVAGRISARLEGPRTDAALVAEAVARAYPSARDALAESANARVLVAEGMTSDIEFCARESTLDLIPRVTGTGPGWAIVTGDPPAGASAQPRRLDPALPAPTP